MSFGLVLFLRIVQSVLAVVVLSLSLYVAKWYNGATLDASPSQVNFLIFVPTFSIITIAYIEIAPRYAKPIFHPYIHLLIEFVNCVFYLSGFIALAVFVANLEFCRGSVCRAIRAAIVVVAISFAVWWLTMVITIIDLGKESMKRGFRRLRQPSGAKVPLMKEEMV